MCNNQLTSTLYAVLFTTCLCQKPSLARILLVRVLTQTAREYNPVQSTFYDVNYIFDKKTTEDDSGSEGKFWRRNRQRARKMRRGSNSHQWICQLQTNAVDSKLSFSLKYDLIFFYSKSLEKGPAGYHALLCCFKKEDQCCSSSLPLLTLLTANNVLTRRFPVDKIYKR